MIRQLLKNIYVPLVIATCMLPSVAWAQTSTQSSKKAEKKGVRFVVTAVAPGSPNVLKLLAKKGIEEVPLSSRSPGDLFALPKDGIVTLGLESADPENPIAPLALGKLPENVTRATALLIPRAKKADGTQYNMLFIDDGNLKGGSVYFLNLTKGACVASLDGKKMKLVPGKPLIYQPSGLKEARNTPVAIMTEIVTNGKKSWRPLMSSTWRMRSSRIEVCIVYWNEEYKRPSIKGLTLFPMAKNARDE